MSDYRNPTLPIGQRVEDLLAKMTLGEKVGQLNQRMYGWQAYERVDGRTVLTEAFAEEVARFDGIGALYGLFRADPWSEVGFHNGIPADEAAAAVGLVQGWIREHTRLGIPALIVEECPHGHQALDSVLFPANLNVGAGWNPQLYAEAAGYVGAEMRAKGVHLGLVSALDIARDPRWGRTEECFAEDPYLAARLTEALVRGMSGSGVGVVLKHFAGQGAGVGGRNGAPAPIGERELREIHLPAALAGVRAGAVGVMAAYNDVDGVPCVAHQRLLTGILREEWGFGWIVMGDGKAVDRLTRMTGDARGAAALALRAGVDLSLWDESFTVLGEAVAAGMVDTREIDRAVRRVLGVKFRLGLFDVDSGETAAVEPSIGVGLSYRLAVESLVLVHNPDDLLPLKGDIRRVAVVGPNGDQLFNQLGDYTPPVRDGVGVTVAAGLRAAGLEVEVVRGYGITAPSEDGFAAAVKAAEWADVVVLALGGSSTRFADTRFADNGAAVVDDRRGEMNCGEGVDLAQLELGGVQQELVAAVAQTGTPIVAVLIQGRPHAVPELPAKCGAVLIAGYPGPTGGTAIADVLLGRVEPTGRLSMSVPRSAGQLPVCYNARESGELDYADESRLPLYPFGFGLGYSPVEYRGPQVRPTDNGVRVEVEVGNVGARVTTEVVQCYLREDTAPVWPRQRELRGFRKVTLAPGEWRTVEFRLGPDELSTWDETLTHRVVTRKLTVFVGGNSTATQKAQFMID